MEVYYHTFGCKANQYDTERMRQEVEARGPDTCEEWEEADVCVVNTCTVTNKADAVARRFIRRVHRENPSARIVVAGCSAALKPAEYRDMDGVSGVVEGQDPLGVAGHVVPSWSSNGGAGGKGAGLVQIELRGSESRGLESVDEEPVGAELLRRRDGATRGWLKIQDGCDRKCAFCATRLARGRSRSRTPEAVVREARLLARRHPELVLTGIHIGHYGRDLAAEVPSAGVCTGDPPAGLRRGGRSGGGSWTLARLLALLLEEVPDVRFRLGSVEATEVDDLLLELLATSGHRVAPHLHMPLQSGADPVLRRMRRWHTREMYRSRAFEIVERLPVLGLGADVITGFPGETEEDHASTRELLEELPYTYVHVFPFSPRHGTVAAELNEAEPVPQRVAGERSRELRELVRRKGKAYREARVGSEARITLEREGTRGLTGDYLRVEVRGADVDDQDRLHEGVLRGEGAHLYIDLPRASCAN